MAFMLQHDCPNRKSRLLKDFVSEGWKPDDGNALKHDFEGVYGPELWNMMEELLDVFPITFALGIDVDILDTGEWDIRLVEGEQLDMIELGIRSVFSATEVNIKEAEELHSECLEERLKYFKQLPTSFRPGISAEAESRWFQGYLPHDRLEGLAELLSKGFPEGSVVSPRPAYAEQRDINLHDVPSDQEEAEDFICQFSVNCSNYDELVDHMDWDEETLRDERKIFEVEIALYLPVITPEIEALDERGEDTGLPCGYIWR